ncbi:MULTISPECIES: FAD-dependent oxidoreductase [Pseudomonas]|uniref:FAD-dependent oxidoreductase n=1 Tax=Pseudomonadaceae TaxID=135621 RepID=UPI00084A8CFB|nr:MULTISPECIES: FAD-dependent oxidoreductase [Pseudomonas]OEC60321.1 hypothetical protein A9G05_07375 [Pseudomonas sp. ENNP23]
MTAQRPVVVVGGGIAGLLAAAWAQACGLPVTLLERAPACGGLLRSFRDASGQVFDIGTHIPAMTGDAVVDGLLFEVPGLAWHEVPVLQVGNAFAGVLDTRSQFIDITRLPEAAYQACLAGLLNTLSSDQGAPDLEAALRRHFGDALAETVFFPLLRRLYQAPFNELSANSHRFLGYGRVIVGSAEVCRELKRSPLYDRKVAFRDYLEGRSAVRHRYPAEGGMGAWIDALCRRFEARGGRLLTSAQVERMEVDARSLRLADGQDIPFEHLIWSAPLAHLARAMGERVDGAPPRFLPLRLFHFVLDQPPACDCHYLYLNDADVKTFRITLYENFLPAQGSSRRMTVEAVDTVGVEPEQQARAILDELRRCGVLGAGCQARLVLEQPVANGFPEITVAQEAASRELRERLLRRFPALLLCGRNAAETFFTTDTLLDTAVQLASRFGQPDLEQGGIHGN